MNKKVEHYETHCGFCGAKIEGNVLVSKRGKKYLHLRDGIHLRLKSIQFVCPRCVEWMIND